MAGTEKITQLESRKSFESSEARTCLRRSWVVKHPPSLMLGKRRGKMEERRLFGFEDLGVASKLVWLFLNVGALGEDFVAKQKSLIM